MYEQELNTYNLFLKIAESSEDCSQDAQSVALENAKQAVANSDPDFEEDAE